MTCLMGVLESSQLYTLGVDESTAFMRLSHKVLVSSSSSSHIYNFLERQMAKIVQFFIQVRNLYEPAII